jgi:chromosome segregation ATPase
MTFIVKTAATLRLADGGSFNLTPGMHDDFPVAVKKHWAFAAYAEPVDTTSQGDTDKKGSSAAKKQIKLLQEQLAERDKTIGVLEQQLSTGQAQLAGQVAQIDTLKARITELEGLAADADELKARIAVLEKPATETGAGPSTQTEKAEGEKKDAKKQPPADS